MKVFWFLSTFCLVSAQDTGNWIAKGNCSMNNIVTDTDQKLRSSYVKQLTYWSHFATRMSELLETYWRLGERKMVCEEIAKKVYNLQGNQTFEVNANNSFTFVQPMFTISSLLGKKRSRNRSLLKCSVNSGNLEFFVVDGIAPRPSQKPPKIDLFVVELKQDRKVTEKCAVKFDDVDFKAIIPQMDYSKLEPQIKKSKILKNIKTFIGF